ADRLEHRDARPWITAPLHAYEYRHQAAWATAHSAGTLVQVLGASNVLLHAAAVPVLGRRQEPISAALVCPTSLFETMHVRCAADAGREPRVADDLEFPFFRKSAARHRRPHRSCRRTRASESGETRHPTRPP